MLNVTEEQKKMFYTSGYSNNYILTFSEIGLVLDNEKLHSETPVIKESICDGEDFTLGGCIASSMEFEVSEILADEMTGLEFQCQIEVKDDDNKIAQNVPMGIFRVDQAQQIDDKDYKKVIAYDRMYDISADVIDWYGEYFAAGAKHTVKQTRESLLTHLGIPFVNQTLVNDDVLVEKTVEVASLPGTDVLRYLCVINAGFGRMNRNGEFEVVYLQGQGIFPEDQGGEARNLYPEDTPGKEILYPEDQFEYLGVSTEDTVCPEYRSCKYEEYMVLPITALSIISAQDDVGVTVGEDLSNPYVIAANIFLYGKSSKDLRKIGQKILEKIKGITYRPNTTQLDGLPYLEVGDVFALEKKNDSVESYIFSRTLSGIQALKDTFEAKGNKVRSNEVSANEEIIQLKGQTLILNKTVDELSAEMTNLEKDTSTKFKQTANDISAEVKRANQAEGELTSSLEMAAGSIVLKTDADGNIVEVGLTSDPKEGAVFQVTAQNIQLTAEEVITLLSGGTINLSSQRVNIESENFSVDEKGNMQASSLTMDGGSISLGDNFEVTENGEVTAKSINIEGGNVNLETTYTGRNLIHLQNITYDAENLSGFKGEVKFFGEGKPNRKLSGTVGDYYLDLSTGLIYVLVNSHGVASWQKYSDISTNDIVWSDININTDGGFSSAQYHLQVLDVDDGTGNLVKQTFKDGSSITYCSDRITFHKTFWETRMGIPRERSIEASIYMDVGESDESLEPTPKLVIDCPLQVSQLITKDDA